MTISRTLGTMVRARALGNVRTTARNGQTALVTQRAIAAGETVINLGGPIRAEPTRYTLQVSEDEHIEPAAIEETPGPDEGEDATEV